MHAQDPLDALIAAYADAGCQWVGITEHMPPAAEAFRYPEEAAAGLTVEALCDQFAEYMAHTRRLQRQWAPKIKIRVGFETETHPGALALAQDLIAAHQPDYIVGSVHHVAQVGFDLDPHEYGNAVAACGGMEAFYCQYFDDQWEMFRTLKPAVIGHFDLVRRFDPEYRRHLALPGVMKRIERNLTGMAAAGAILDVNTAALDKGFAEPYPAEPILSMAARLGMKVVPGDDSHCLAHVGRHMDATVKQLAAMGFSLDWPVPRLNPV